ncbi:MAG: hypothetical protein KGL02_05120 [Acidobacteriota bacterium]|nr:hypothetical protein [Acidobacteriota bacterium]MDE3169555.1 hypothetical protein [Acidobacteriota bacterium]
MIAPTEENDPILSRIERLEEQNRRWRRGAMIALVAVVSIGLTAQTRSKRRHAPAHQPAAAPGIPKNIEAESFTLKDDSGRVRAELAMSGTGPSLKLFDEHGSALAVFCVNDTAPGGPFVTLSDPAHHAGLSMSVLEGAGSELSMMGEGENAQVHIGVTKDGTTLELFDQDGFSTDLGNGMQTTRSGKLKKTSAASIALFNKDRKVLWSAP